MNEILNFISENTAIILITLSIGWLGILLAYGIIYKRLKRLQDKYNAFIGESSGTQVENMLMDHLKKVEENIATQKEIVERYNHLETDMEECIQKIGVVRYNPFDEMGGNLCFAVALLDKKDNGIVLNGIHSREGSYTYAKPVENGQSKYTLSAEEIQALDMARRKAYRKGVKTL